MVNARYYRPDIDGLRAVAVVPVILFHAGLPSFRGVYVGVDVFFVISGFLITSIIAREIDADGFSFLRFYERRARRILPALFFILFCCLPFAWAWMLPVEMRAFTASLLSVLAFLSNIYFWNQSGYFDAPSETKPLLHTWSLAVEEQFYIVFPVLLLALWRFRKSGVVGGIATIALASFAACEWASRIHPDFNFYWIFTRFWELAVGALAALAPFEARPRRDAIVSSLGLAAVVASVFLLDSTTRFPSAYALAPVLGTAAVLRHGAGGGPATRLLSLPPMVAIGLVSYSAYLWHQPMLAFARLRFSTLSGLELAVLLAAILPLSWLSWRYVEMPWRKTRDGAIGRARLTQAVVAAAAMLGCFGVAGVATGGLPQRMSAEVLALAAAADDVGVYGEKCLAGLSVDMQDPRGACRLGAPDRPPRFVLFGDSYAAALADGLGAAALQAGEAGIFVGVNSCAPIIGIGGYWSRSKERCAAFQQAMPDLVERLGVRTVVLQAFWAQLEKPSMLAQNGAAPDGVAAFATPLQRTLDELKQRGVRVFIVCCTPDADEPVPAALARLRLTGGSPDIGPSTERFRYENRTALALFASPAVREKARIIDVTGFFCDATRCRVADEGRPLFFDSGHLTKTAALRLAPFFAPVFTK